MNRFKCAVCGDIEYFSDPIPDKTRCDNCIRAEAALFALSPELKDWLFRMIDRKIELALEERDYHERMNSW